MPRIHTQQDWINRARSVLPAGGLGNFDPSIIIQKGQGSRVWDENGAEYIDYLIGSGPMLLGMVILRLWRRSLSNCPKA